MELANLVVDTIEKKPSEPLNFSYSENDSVEQKIEKIACNLYGASVVTYSIHSRKIIKLIEKMGIGHYPVCIAKTQYSFSADPKIYGAVNNFEFHIKDIVINNGAEMIVAIAGEILRMPGLPQRATSYAHRHCRWKYRRIELTKYRNRGCRYILASPFHLFQIIQHGFRVFGQLFPVVVSQ